MDIEIRHCNNIVRAHITLTADKLRIPLYSITDWHRSPISDSHPFDQPGT